VGVERRWGAVQTKVEDCRSAPILATRSTPTAAPRAPREPSRGRLGVYQDGPFRLVETSDGIRLAPDPVDAPFLAFVCEVAEEFESLHVFARIVGPGAAEAQPLLPPETGVVRLPDYGSLSRLGSVARAGFGTIGSFWRGLSRVDTVWAFGPHPFQLLLVVLAAARGKRVVLGVRQDTPAYFRARLPSPRWRPVLAAIGAMDALHRLFARRLPATVVGTANAARYASPHGSVLAMTPSLVRVADLVSEPPEHDWTGTIELLTVGRIDSEKNPLLLVEAMAALERARPGRYRLRWAGVGPLAGDVRRRAAELGIEDLIELVGYVPFGPQLLALYREAHAFVHVSLTEGVPQVLAEALASGTPVVATDVGGVGAALEHGRAGLLVPPSALDALTEAVLKLSEDAELRSQQARRGLELARERTLEAEAARVARFLRGEARSGENFA
jgi:glycosyltransferase involved in cell wall biosynthesis